MGNGQGTLFWEDRWIGGYRVCELAPLIYERIPKRIRSTRTVSAALPNGVWAGDVGPDLSAAAIQQFLDLWPRVAAVQLDTEMEDTIRWGWEKEGCFLARSAYAAKFAGLEVSPSAAFTWKSKALQCRFFAWLALKNRCWTSDRLARRGLPHQAACPFCDQHDETLNHLLLDCVFAKEVWHRFSFASGRPEFEPLDGETLGDWCARQERRGDQRRNNRAMSPRHRHVGALEAS